jgi:hypothetical protein
MECNRYPTDEQIRERAYRLWLEAGKPEDREQEFGIKRSGSSKFSQISQTSRTIQANGRLEFKRPRLSDF